MRSPRRRILDLVEAIWDRHARGQDHYGLDQVLLDIVDAEAAKLPVRGNRSAPPSYQIALAELSAAVDQVQSEGVYVHHAVDILARLSGVDAGTLRSFRKDVRRRRKDAVTVEHYFDCVALFRRSPDETARHVAFWIMRLREIVPKPRR